MLLPNKPLIFLKQHKSFPVDEKVSVPSRYVSASPNFYAKFQLFSSDKQFLL